MFNVDYDVVEELNIGETRFRLVEDHERKTRKIQLWSSLSKQWNVTHRHNVDAEWAKWKLTFGRTQNRKVQK